MSQTPGGRYALRARSEALRRITLAWLLLALASLVAAGVFAALLVGARTPLLQLWLPGLDWFGVALVVHVNLSVLIWLWSVAGAMWTLSATRERSHWDRLSLAFAIAGAATLIASPFLGAGDPLINNYVPVLQHPLFFGGLGLFAAGVASHATRTLADFRAAAQPLDGRAALAVGIRLAALITALTFAAFIASWAGTPAAMDGQVYFEFLFWGAGHVLQFNHTVLMLVAWIVLAAASGGGFALTPRLTLVFLVIVALPVITVPFLYVAHDVVSAGHRLAFTELMKFGGLSCLPLGLAVLASLWRAGAPVGPQRPLRASIEASIVLFAVGGVLGFMIAGLDVVIPAHYHGSTVGVTIAFMGLTYYLLPRLGCAAPEGWLATWQPYCYGGGQLLHILGLAWTGGYGVQRKTAGLAEGVDRFGEIAGMTLMGIGGAISVLGGLAFLIVAYGAIRKRPAGPVTGG